MSLLNSVSCCYAADRLVLVPDNVDDVAVAVAVDALTVACSPQTPSESSKWDSDRSPTVVRAGLALEACPFPTSSISCSRRRTSRQRRLCGTGSCAVISMATAGWCPRRCGTSTKSSCTA